MRIGSNQLRRSVEKESGLAGIEHLKVVIAVTDRNGVIMDALESFDGGKLTVLDTHFVGKDFSGRGDLQGVAQDGRHAELLHVYGR